MTQQCRRTGNRNSNKYLLMNVHTSMIHKSQEVETIQMSLSE